MRLTDGLRHLGGLIGAVALIYEEHLILGGLFFVAASLLSLLVWDVRRAGGFGAWSRDSLSSIRVAHDLLELIRKRRAGRRTRRLLDREEQLEIQMRISEKRDGGHRDRKRRSRRRG
jgi:predicted Rdx family selenoprotein